MRVDRPRLFNSARKDFSSCERASAELASKVKGELRKSMKRGEEVIEGKSAELFYVLQSLSELKVWWLFESFFFFFRGD